MGWRPGATPRRVANRKVLYDARRRTHTAQGVALSTIHGDLLWCDGGWPGSCHEHELLEVSGVRAVLDASGVTALVDRGFRAMAKVRARWHASIGDRRTNDQRTPAERDHHRLQAGLRPGGAGDRASGQRVDAAALAWPAVPGPGRLPGRRGAHLPRPMAPPHPDMEEASGHPH